MSIPGLDTVLGPSSSGQIGVPSDDSTNMIQLFQTVLFDLATITPFIDPIVKPLGQALQMRNEVRQWKEECRRVMQKLVDTADTVIKFGKACEKHNLKGRDLPANLPEILGTFQRVLDMIEHELQECAKTKAVKGFFLRKDLLMKIQRCESEFIDALRKFENALQSEMWEMLLEMRELLSKMQEMLSETREGLSETREKLSEMREKLSEMPVAQIDRRQRRKNKFDCIRRLWKGGKRSDG